jgi:hypothetical protein
VPTALRGVWSEMCGRLLWSLAVQCIFAVHTALRGVWSEMRGRYLRSLAVQCIFAVHTALRGVRSEMRGRYLRSLAVQRMFAVHSAVWGVSSEMCGRLLVVVGSPMHICGAHSGVGCVVRDLRCTERCWVCGARFAVHTSCVGCVVRDLRYFSLVIGSPVRFCGEMGAVCTHAENIGGDAASG